MCCPLSDRKKSGQILREQVKATCYMLLAEENMLAMHEDQTGVRGMSFSLFPPPRYVLISSLPLSAEPLHGAEQGLGPALKIESVEALCDSVPH